MREIKNNVEIGKAKKANTKNEKQEKAEPQFCVEMETDSEIKDFSNPSAEVLGRSQVNKADNLKADVAFGAEHPETIASADKFFDIAYNTLQTKKEPNAYEIAATMASIYANEITT